MSRTIREIGRGTRTVDGIDIGKSGYWKLRNVGASVNGLSQPTPVMILHSDLGA